MTSSKSNAGIATDLNAILARIGTARKAAIVPAPQTSLIAVSKGHAVEQILPTLEAGHRLFGENRVQEAKEKWPRLRKQFNSIELHLIGPLQTNKTREAVELFDAIHSLDRPKLAASLHREIARTGRAPMLFVQVNTGEEPQKTGVSPKETAKFISQCHEEYELSVAGLMCIPPLDENPAPHFALLKKLAGESGLQELSMGMSADFETAIRFGTTHVRIGTAIFGERTLSR